MEMSYKSFSTLPRFPGGRPSPDANYARDIDNARLIAISWLPAPTQAELQANQAQDLWFARSFSAPWLQSQGNRHWRVNVLSYGSEEVHNEPLLELFDRVPLAAANLHAYLLDAEYPMRVKSELLRLCHSADSNLVLFCVFFFCTCFVFFHCDSTINADPLFVIRVENITKLGMWSDTCRHWRTKRVHGTRVPSNLSDAHKFCTAKTFVRVSMATAVWSVC